MKQIWMAQQTKKLGPAKTVMKSDRRGRTLNWELVRSIHQGLQA